MAKRIIHQCDKCDVTKEVPNVPAGWVTGEIKFGTGLSEQPRMWCGDCWRAINTKHPKAGNANA